MRVRLVAHVPDEAILGRLEDVVQRYGELDRAEVRGEVAAGLGDGLHEEGAQLRGELGKLPAVQLAQVSGVGDLVEQWVGGHGR